MPRRSSKRNILDVEIIAETPDYLVVNKPAGLIVHPATRERGGDSLVEYLVTKYPELEQVGETRPWYRPGIVHRLDRDASGVLVVARTPAMYVHLRKEFEEHRVEKTYIVLVEGTLPDASGTIEILIARDPEKKRMITPGESDDPTLTWLPAVTHWKKIEEFPNATLLEVRTETGRTQQIRVHMASVGHPVVGDHLYGTKGSLKRLFLHASHLGFTDRDNARQEFHAPLPAQLKDYLISLK